VVMSRDRVEEYDFWQVFLEKQSEQQQLERLRLA